MSHKLAAINAAGVKVLLAAAESLRAGAHNAGARFVALEAPSLGTAAKLHISP
jgi:hypothetical protein